MAHRVVILGGGFAGLYATRALKSPEFEITLVDRRNFHLFQPLLYQVATGELSPADVAFPLRAIFRSRKNVRVILAEATGLDAASRRVLLDDGSSESYDTLIVATGARNHYFGNDTWAERAPGLKSIEEATRIRHRILYAFEAAERTVDREEHLAWLTFVIVGAGPTGVEMAGAIGEIANDTLKADFRRTRPEEARILLLDAAPRLLTTFAEDLSLEAERALIKLGVRSIMGVKVVAVDADGVRIATANGEEHIRAHTVLWAAGVAAAHFAATLAEATGAQRDRAGRIIVDDRCRIPGHPEIFVIGDAAYFAGPDGKPLPGVAPVAMQQGRYVASLLRGRTDQPFRYRDKGSLAVIGRASAVAQFPLLKAHGLFAWLLWLFIHLMYLVGFQNRLIVFIRWAFNYFTYNRGARLITGDEPRALP